MPSKEIPLSNGGSAIVDEGDYDFLAQWKWKRHTQGYACRTGWKDRKWTCILMHRIVAQTPPELETDHINNNKLDNRRCNLRNVTHSQNELNKPLSSRNTSGFKGVTWDKSRGKWAAKTKHAGHMVNLGRFDTPQAASEAYQRWHVEHS